MYRMTSVNANTKRAVTKIVVSALAVLMVLLVIALIVNLVRLSAANERNRSLASQNARLDKMRNENAVRIEYCQSDEFAKDYAREYLDMVYRGEEIYAGEKAE